VNRIFRSLAAVAIVILTLAACGGGDADAAPNTGPRAADGDLVRVHYTGTLEDGTVFDSSREAGRSPLEFTVASGQVITGFDDAVRGLAVGETRIQRVEPIDGYGEVNPDAIVEVSIDQLPEGTAVGDTLSSGTGQTVVVLAIDTATGMAQLDANHPLAGKVMFFDVELVEIVPAS